MKEIVEKWQKRYNAFSILARAESVLVEGK